MGELEGLLSHFNHWAWWVGALIFFVIELALPGVFFLWLGLAAVATGLIAFIAPGLGWQMHVGIFAVLGVIAAVVGRRYWKPGASQSSEPALNQRTTRYIGHVFTLQTPIVNGHGRAEIGDSAWAVAGPDLPAGARVRVVGADGARLIVEAASAA